MNEKRVSNLQEILIRNYVPAVGEPILIATHNRINSFKNTKIKRIACFGYCSDFGRSFYFGKASCRIKDAYKALQAAQVKVIETIKPGDKINTYLHILLDELGKHGFAENLFRHSEKVTMGHQIGINVHEHPWLLADQEEVFKPGMVMCIEPKIWLPGECYLRVEDMVLITETGAESLTKFSRDKFEI